MRTILVTLVFGFIAQSSFAQGPSWTIDDALKEARDHHPAIVQAEAILMEARGERRQALSLEPPAAAIEYEGVPSGSGINAYEERRLSLSQELEFPLLYLWRSARQNELVASSEFRQFAMLLEFETELRLAYLDAWYTKERLNTLEEYAVTLDSQAVVFQRMQQVGRVGDLDVNRALAEAAEIQSDLLEARADYRSSVNLLLNLVDRESLPGELISPIHEEAIDITYESGWERNPELNALKHLSNSEEKARTLSKLSWLPSLEVSGFRQTIPASVDGNDFWGLEVGLSVPLWYFWGGVGEIQASTARSRRAAASLQRRQIELENQWYRSLEQLEARRERIETFDNVLLPTSESIAQMALRSYENGRADYLDVLEAQRSLLQRRFGYFEAVRDLATTQITIRELSGNSQLIVNIEDLE